MHGVPRVEHGILRHEVVEGAVVFGYDIGRKDGDKPGSIRTDFIISMRRQRENDRNISRIEQIRGSVDLEAD